MDVILRFRFAEGREENTCYLPANSYDICGSAHEVDRCEEVVHLWALLLVEARDWYLAGTTVDPEDWIAWNTELPTCWDWIALQTPEQAAQILLAMGGEVPDQLRGLVYGKNLALGSNGESGCSTSRGSLLPGQERSTQNAPPWDERQLDRKKGSQTRLILHHLWKRPYHRSTVDSLSTVLWNSSPYNIKTFDQALSRARKFLEQFGVYLDREGTDVWLDLPHTPEVTDTSPKR
jgi:hypothetical protein